MSASIALRSAPGASRGSYPIVGVNTFLARLRAFQARNAETAPAALERLRRAAIANENLFAVLMDAVRCCSLGQITTALYEVGGQYRRNM